MLPGGGDRRSMCSSVGRLLSTLRCVPRPASFFMNGGNMLNVPKRRSGGRQSWDGSIIYASLYGGKSELPAGVTRCFAWTLIAPLSSSDS